MLQMLYVKILGIIKCYAQKNYEPYYFDSNHLSNKGSEKLSKIIFDKMNN